MALLYLVPLLLVIGGACVMAFLWLLRPMAVEQAKRSERAMQRRVETAARAPARGPKPKETAPGPRS